jgi:hypothetical protein
MNKRILMVSLSILLMACQLFSSMGEKISESINAEGPIDSNQPGNATTDKPARPGTAATVVPLNADGKVQPMLRRAIACRQPLKSPATPR